MSGHNFAGPRPLVSLGVPLFVLEAGAPVPCRADPDAYFVAGLRPASARALCSGCAYFEACQAYALGQPELWGVWGGTTQGERTAARRRATGERGPPGLRWAAHAVRLSRGRGLVSIRADVRPCGYR